VLCFRQVIRQSLHVEIGHVRVEAPPSYDQMGQSNNTDGIGIINSSPSIYIFSFWSLIAKRIINCNAVLIHQLTTQYSF
jgi:hypothetical protein